MSEAKSLSWDEVVAKFVIRGVSPEMLGRLTRKQVVFALEEMNEELKKDIILAGGKVEEEDDDFEADELAPGEFIIEILPG